VEEEEERGIEDLPREAGEAAAVRGGVQEEVEGGGGEEVEGLLRRCRRPLGGLDRWRLVRFE
jgi:hypothetical protein